MQIMSRQVLSQHCSECPIEIFPTRVGTNNIARFCSQGVVDLWNFDPPGHTGAVAGIDMVELADAFLDVCKPKVVVFQNADSRGAAHKGAIDEWEKVFRQKAGTNGSEYELFALEMSLMDIDSCNDLRCRETTGRKHSIYVRKQGTL